MNAITQVVYRAQADPSQLRAHPRGGADAEPDRRAARLLRGVPADERPAGQPAACRAAGSVQVGVPDRRLRRPRPARVRLLRTRGAEVRRRGVHPARHDLCRAAEGHSAPDRLGRGRGHRRAVDPRHQGTARLHGRHAADDRQRHVHHQWHRARHRLADAPLARRVLRPRQGQDPFVRQVPVRRAGDPVPRLLARLRVRQQGPRLRPHRPEAEAAGHHAALRAGERGHGEAARRARGEGRDAGAWRDPRHGSGGDPRLLLRPGGVRPHAEGLGAAVRSRRVPRREAAGADHRRRDRRGGGRRRGQADAAPGAAHRREDQGGAGRPHRPARPLRGRGPGERRRPARSMPRPARNSPSRSWPRWRRPASPSCRRWRWISPTGRGSATRWRWTRTPTATTR